LLPTASKTAAVASNVAKLVNVSVEILLKLEEFPKQKWGIGAAICTQGQGCERAILLTLNRGWHPILRKALLGSDRVMVTYFAGLLLGAFIVFNRRLAVVRALEQKIKRAGGCRNQSSWKLSHLSLADLATASGIFERVESLPIFGAEAELGEIYLLRTLTVVVPAAAAQVWQHFGERHQEGQA